MPKWRQDRDTGELLPVETRLEGNRSTFVHGDIVPFVSPIDGSLIGSRRDLRVHNERHDVTQHQEYGENCGEEYFQRAAQERNARLTGQTRRDREERLAAIIPIVNALDKPRHG